MLKVSPQVRRYCVGVLAVASATLLTLGLWPLLKPHVTPLFFAAVMFSAWYGGLGPGLLSTMLSTLIITYFSSTLPYGAIIDLAAVLRLGVFGVVALSISSAYAQLHAAKQRSEVNLLKLKASEERYRCIVETAKEGIWVVDAQLRTEYVNQRLAEMFGYTVEEMRDRPIFDFMDDKSRILAERHIDRNRQNIKQQFDFCYQRKDGSPLWAIVCTNQILNERGEFSGAIAMLTDVTERKQAEEVLKRSQLLFEHSRDIVLFVRLDGKIIEANNAAVQAYGYDREELLDLKIEDLRAPQTLALIAEQLEQADKQGILFETIHRRKDGSFFPVEVSAQSKVIGKEKLILSIIRDITKRKTAQEGLRKSEERYRAFIEHSSEGIWRFELEQPISPELSEDEQIQHFYQYGYLAECNNVMARIYGFDCAQEIVGARLGDLLIPSEPNNIEYLRAFIRSGYRLNDAESHEVDKQGLSKYFLNNLVGIAENGLLVRAWGTQRDITDRKRAEESSRQLAKQVQEQANTLNAILSASVDHIYIFDRAGRYKYVSAGGSQILGFQPDQLVGKSWKDIGLPSNLMQPFDAQREEVVSTGQPLKSEIDFSTASGWRHYEYIITPLLNQEQSIDGVVVVSRDTTKRKQAEEALRESEERFRTFFEEAPIGISVVDLQGRYLKVNKTYCEMLGYLEPELHQLTFAAITHPENLETDLHHAQQIFKGEIANYQLEKRYIKKNGEILWANLTATAIFDQDGQALYRLGMVEDISDRKRTQEALRISEAKFRRLVESNIVGVSIAEHGGCIKEANDAYLQMIGYTREELVAGRLNWREITPPEYLPLDQQALDEINSTGACSPFEKENIRKDGSRIPILVGCALLEGSQDTAICFILDLTERKRAEEAVKQSEERFRKLAEKVRVIPWEADATTGNFTYIGPQTVDILGYPLSDWYADNFWFEHMHPEDQEWAIKYCIDSSAILDNYEFEYRMLSVDGRVVWLYDIVNVVRTEDGPSVLRGFMIDITERKRAEEEREQLLAREQEARQEAEAANRMKDEFLATLSHELRTPLNAMLGWTQLLRTRKFDSATVARALETIDRNTKSLSQLIEDVLDVSRIITGKLRLNIRPVELVPVIEAAIETVLPAAEAKGIQIESVLDPHLGKVLGDSARLQQVVWNLLSNAVKFTPNGGRVEVGQSMIEEELLFNRLRVEGSTSPSNLQPYVQIRVSDTGQGISADFLPHVFERFRQADGTTTRSHGGLGLGLAIVRHLVELQGGTVHAESAGIGQGATFIVKLPLLKDEVARMKDESDNPIHPSSFIVHPSLDDLRVLVVDDEPDARELLSAMLGEYGAEVIAVATAREALEALHRWKPNVLLSDIGMPEEDGYALIRKVRALDAEQGGRIPAVALTAYARAEDRTQALIAGFQLHVPKPINPAELAVVVAKLASGTERL